MILRAIPPVVFTCAGMGPFDREVVVNSSDGINFAREFYFLRHERVAFAARNVCIDNREVLGRSAVRQLEYRPGNILVFKEVLHLKVAGVKDDVFPLEMPLKSFEERFFRFIAECSDGIKEFRGKYAQDPFRLPQDEFVFACLDFALDLGKKVFACDRPFVLGELDGAGQAKQAFDDGNIDGDEIGELRIAFAVERGAFKESHDLFRGGGEVEKQVSVPRAPERVNALEFAGRDYFYFFFEFPIGGIDVVHVDVREIVSLEYEIAVAPDKSAAGTNLGLVLE